MKRHKFIAHWIPKWYLGRIVDWLIYIDDHCYMLVQPIKVLGNEINQH